MRLKNSNDPTIREHHPSRLQGGLNGGRMMCIVVDPVNAVNLPAMFESTLHAGEFGNSANRAFDGYSAFHRSSNRSQSILTIMNSRHLQMNQSEICCFVSKQKCLVGTAG